METGFLSVYNNPVTVSCPDKKLVKNARITDRHKIYRKPGLSFLNIIPIPSYYFTIYRLVFFPVIVSDKHL
jgi:hypothetical protein